MVDTWRNNIVRWTDGRHMEERQSGRQMVDTWRYDSQADRWRTH